MSMKHILTVRLDEKDMEKLRRDALATNRTISDHIRLLIRTPVELSEGDDAVLVFSLFELGKIETQVRRWGLNFNQSVHVMNFLAMWVRGGGSLDEGFAPSFNKVADNLMKLKYELLCYTELLAEFKERTAILDSPHSRAPRKSLLDQNIADIKGAQISRL